MAATERTRPPAQATGPAVPAQPAPPIEGTAAGTAAGVAAGVATAVPAIAAGALSITAVLKAFREFLDAFEIRTEKWLRLRFADKPVDDGEIAQVMAEERTREREFRRKVLERVRRDTKLALGLPTEEERAARILAILGREQHFARQRSMAMAVRALSAIDRLVLRRESPTGAFWKLDPAVEQHTKDCLAMAGRVWPWIVLDIFHPPTHTGCRCSLHGERVAAARGWWDGRRMSDREALERALKARALLHEGEYEATRDAALKVEAMTEGQWEAALAAVLRSSMEGV